MGEPVRPCTAKRETTPDLRRRAIVAYETMRGASTGLRRPPNHPLNTPQCKTQRSRKGVNLGVTVLRRRLVVFHDVQLLAVSHHVGVVKRMRNAGVDMEFEDLTRLQRRAKSLAACRRMTPVVVLAHQHQQRHIAMRIRIDAGAVIVDRGTEAESPRRRARSRWRRSLPRATSPVPQSCPGRSRSRA